MFCIECGKNIEASAKFCAGCGSKQNDPIGPASSETESNSNTINSQNTVVKKWYQRTDLQFNNSFCLIMMLMLIFFMPFVKLTFTDTLLTNIEPIYIRPIQEIAGWVMVIIIFFMFYLNYVKKFKPLIFMFPFLSLCMIMMILAATVVTEPYYNSQGFKNPLKETHIQITSYLFVILGITMAFKNHKLRVL